MTRRWLPLIGVLVLCAACGDGVEIHGAALLDDGCAWEGDASGPLLDSWILDLSLVKDYDTTLVVSNDRDPSREAASRKAAINVEGAEVTFTSEVPALQAALQADLFVPQGAVVLAGSTATVEVQVISESLGRQMEATGFFRERGDEAVVTVGVTLKGKTARGREVTSNTFAFPLRICVGCLLEHPPDALFTDDDGSPTCDLSKAPLGNPASPELLSYCRFGQDSPVDCRACRSVLGDPTWADAVCDP